MWSFSRQRFAGISDTVLSLFLTCSILQICSSAPVQTYDDIVNYLQTYGYRGNDTSLHQGSADIMDENSFKALIRDFQYHAGLNQTGEFDDDTSTMMNAPRCGVTDKTFSNGDVKRRKKRYVLEGSRWRSTDLTYAFINSSAKLSDDIVKTIFRIAFSIWASSSPLTFTLTNNIDSATIRILFGKKDHGDPYPFDGPLGVLGHSFFPDSFNFRGAAHFDDEENWTYQNSRGTDLQQVALHEIGHTLGLAHSTVRGSVMFPFYTGYSSSPPQLSDDDIKGIQLLYGKPNVPSRPSVTVPDSGRPPVVPSPGTTGRTGTTGTTVSIPRGDNTLLCADPTIDAIVVAEGLTYVFKGKMYFKLANNAVMDGYPKAIKSTWPEIDGPIDTVLYYEPAIVFTSQGIFLDPGHLFLFKGSQYWRYENINELSGGYPKKIRDGFKGIPDSPDAALIWSGNGQIYFFSGYKYYRYSRGVGADLGYPQNITRWGGLPNKVDAAFQWIDGRTYFFAGTQFYRFNDPAVKVDTGYPRPTASAWFGCGPSNLEFKDSDAGDQFAKMDKSTTVPDSGQVDRNDYYNGASITASMKYSTLSALVILLLSNFVSLSKVF